MKKLLRVIIYPFIFIYLLFILAPKTEGFYLLEEFLQTKKVVFSNEKHVDFGLMFHVKNPTIYFDSIKAGSIENSSLLFTLFYNRVSVKNFVIAKDFKDFFPGDIEILKATHTILFPHIIKLQGRGEFGELEGEVNLVQREMRVLVRASGVLSRKYGQLLRGFKKTKEGYLYVQRF